MIPFKTDILIIGGGVAGLSLSIFLKRMGVKHLVLDRRKKVKPFALGESLPPSVLPFLDSVSLKALFTKSAFRKSFGYHSMWGNRRVFDQNFFRHHPYKYGLKIDKAQLIETLGQEVSDQILLFDRMSSLFVDDGGVTAGFDSDKMIHAQLIIDATGRNSGIVRRLRGKPHDYDQLVAFSCHLPKKRHPKLKHDVYVESFRHGWGIASGISDTELALTLFTKKSSPIFGRFGQYENWEGILVETAFLNYFMVEKEHVTIFGKGANSTMVPEIYRNRCLAVGDAAIAFDPLSSHGITNAVYMAHQAAQAIQSYLMSRSEAPLYHYAEMGAKIFNDYMAIKTQIYQTERRWLTAPFWYDIADYPYEEPRTTVLQNR